MLKSYVKTGSPRLAAHRPRDRDRRRRQKKRQVSPHTQKHHLKEDLGLLEGGSVCGETLTTALALNLVVRLT